MDKTFSWSKVEDMMENCDFIMGFDFMEHDNYVEFTCRDTPFWIDIEKSKIQSWLALETYFRDVFNDFDPNEFCYSWLDAARNRKDLTVPDIHELVEVADYIQDSLDTLVIAICQERSRNEAA